MAVRTLLITGATGKQGGAVIDALLKSSQEFKILALTRNTSSSSAESLSSKPNVTVVEGDPANPGPIFITHKPIYGVFSVTALGTKAGQEEIQAQPLIDESIKNGVDHFVFTSVDRGGPGVSEKNPTEFLHFQVKHRIEEYLKKQAAGTQMQWTVLRPTAFMDNLVPGFGGKLFASMWAGVGNKPLQLISVRDIGVFAARAFADPIAYNGRAISLAGDELTVEQAKEVFKDTMGYDTPTTYRLVGVAAGYMMAEIGTMFKWFREVGYAADMLLICRH